MTSLVVWAVFVVFFVLLGLVAHNFSLGTVRWISGITAVILVCAITRYGIDLWHQAHSNAPPSNLVNAFTAGADGLIKVFLRPLLLGYHGSPPGPIGRGVAAVVLLLGYRQLESWTISRQAPRLHSATLSGGRPGGQRTGGSADAGGGGEGSGSMTGTQLHDLLAAELEFRLAAMEVRAPSILPGGSRTIGLASIAEASGAPGGGLAGAIIRFADSIWPNPRQLRLRVWVEPPAVSATATGPRATSDIRVTVYLENPRNGTTVATKTLAAADINEAASMVAGYVARQVFTQDPSTPPWCYGLADGGDLAALLLARLERVRSETPQNVEASRHAQIDKLWQSASTAQSAGIVRYELAQLLDLNDHHLAALRLHAMNRDRYPRFYRGRYRLGMSLEMIANPELKLPYDVDSKRQLDEILGILNLHHLTVRAKRREIKNDTGNDLRQCADDKMLCTLSPSLRLDLLTAAARELREARAQLTLGRVVWDTFRHRNERTIWLPYWTWLSGWGLRQRWAFHDGVRVAELLIAIQIKLIEPEFDDGESEDKELSDALKLAATLVKKNLRYYEGAIQITSVLAGESEEIRRVQSERIRRVLDQDITRRGGILSPHVVIPWHRRGKASWQAAYNAACLYAALARQDQDQAPVVACLRSAVGNPRSEMERAYDWISRDPDLSCLKGPESASAKRDEQTPFKEFLDAQERLDYPAAFPAERPGAQYKSGAPKIPGRGLVTGRRGHHRGRMNS